MTTGILLWSLATSVVLGSTIEPPPEPSQPAGSQAEPADPTPPQDIEAPPPEPNPDPPDPATPPPAAVRAKQHFEAGQWDEAIEALMEAYADDPDPVYLYARAQAERMRGNCTVAVALYRRFLETGPTERQRADTERHIRLCEEILFNEQQAEAEAAELPTPQAPADEGDARAEPIDEPASPRPWSRDPLGLSLVVGGGGMLAAGATVWGLGQRDLRRAPNSATEEDYERRTGDGRRRMIIGASLAGVGVAVAIVGIVRLATLRRRSRTLASGWGGPGLRGVGVLTRF